MAEQLAWRKSTYSGPHDNCVEVAGTPGGSRAIRDSKQPGPTLTATQAGWRSFLDAVRLDGVEDC